MNGLSDAGPSVASPSASLYLLAMTDPQHDKILIVDFGSQVTQLIARRVREEGVYCEIVPFQKAEAAFREMRPQAVILSGGPESVTADPSPSAPHEIFADGTPVFGICYGQQTMAQQLGGEVEAGHSAEFGRAEIEILADSPLYRGIWHVGHKYPVWMSHGDRVTKLPDGFEPLAASDNAPFAIVADEGRRLYGVQFHPEVMHTPHGALPDPQLRPGHRGLQRRLDDGRLQGRGDRPHPGPGRRRPGHLRSLGRRRFGGGRPC